MAGGSERAIAMYAGPDKFHRQTQPADSRDRLHNICCWAHTGPRQIIMTVALHYNWR